MLDASVQSLNTCSIQDCVVGSDTVIHFKYPCSCVTVNISND